MAFEDSWVRVSEILTEEEIALHWSAVMSVQRFRVCKRAGERWVKRYAVVCIQDILAGVKERYKTKQHNKSRGLKGYWCNSCRKVFWIPVGTSAQEAVQIKQEKQQKILCGTCVGYVLGFERAI